MAYFTACENEGPTCWVRVDGDAVQGYRSSGAVVFSGTAAVEEVLRAHLHPMPRWGSTELAPGEFHPRIQPEAKLGPPRLTPDMPALFPRECQSALQSANILFARLAVVLRYLEPATANLDAFGHELRHLLVLACTEVETGLKAVLNANGVAGDHLNVRDYRRLLEPMRLGEWRVELPSYPEFPELQPFADWPDGPEHYGPKWWRDHNAVKHNREVALSQATLRNVLDSMAAVYITVAAQFGAECLHLRYGIPNGFTDMVVADFPSWEPGEFYIPPRVPGGHNEWTAKPLFQPLRGRARR